MTLKCTVCRRESLSLKKMNEKYVKVVKYILLLLNATDKMDLEI